MADRIIEDIKRHFLERLIPNSTIIQDILKEKSPKLKKAISLNAPAESGMRREAINEIIRLLYEGDINEAHSISKNNDNSPEEFLDLAKIAFDLAAIEKKPKSQFNLIKNFLLDHHRINAGVIAYMIELISKSKYKEAAELRIQYKETLEKSEMEQVGKRLFEQAMTFNPTDVNRDYRTAKAIKEIFELDENLCKKRAHIQYDYNITHDRMEDAIHVAQLFKISTEKILQAVLALFKNKFEDFVRTLYGGHYRGNLELDKRDPYKQAVFVVEKNKLLDLSLYQKSNIDIINEIQNTAFALIQRLNSYAESAELGQTVKVFFTGALISDYRLMKMQNTKRSMESKEIAQSMLEGMEENLNLPDQAAASYHVLYELYKNSIELRKAVKSIAVRIFDIFLNHDRIKLLHQTQNDFELTTGDTLPHFKKKVLNLLEEECDEKLEELDKSFSFMDMLRTDDDFMKKAFHLFSKCTGKGDFSRGLFLQKLLRFPVHRIAVPLKLALKRPVKEGKIDEVNSVMTMFNLKKRHILDLLLAEYDRKLNINAKSAAAFRHHFNLSIGDIGFFHWLFREVLHF